LDHKLGSARLRWDGKVEGGALAKAGKYRARILARDSAGDLRQSRDLDFVHDTVANQKAKWAQVQGRLAFDDGGSAANAEVELVDEEGNVVARTRSTGAGQYRFKGVSADKNYKVRVKKKGFRAESKEFAPSRAEDEAVDLDVKEEQ